MNMLSAHRDNSSGVAQRFPQIDWLRALGIFFVVWGHHIGTPVWIKKEIFSFHMPLFFFLAGYVLSSKKVKMDFTNFAKSLFNSVLKPYLYFGIFGYVAWLCLSRKVGGANNVSVSLWTPVRDFVYGTGNLENLQPIVLWFFPCLFVVNLLFWSLRKWLNQSWFLVSVFVVAALGVSARKLTLPFEMETAFLVFPFFVIGFYTKNLLEKMAWFSLFLRRVWPLVLSVGLFFGWMNEFVDVRGSHFGNFFLYFFAAIFSIFGFYGLASIFPATRLSSRVSQATLVIFPLHLTLFSLFAGVFVFVFHLPLDIRARPDVAFLSSLVALFLLTWVSPYISKLVRG